MKRIVTLISISLLTIPSYSQWEEQDIKFLLLKKFVTQIEWPSDFNQKEFKIGVFGSMGLYRQISQMDIRPYHAGTSTVSYYYINNIESLVACNIIYVPNEFTDELNVIQKNLEGHPILYITEKDGALEEGSMINFITRNDGNITYEINKAALKESKLYYSHKIVEGSTYAD